MRIRAHDQKVGVQFVDFGKKNFSYRSVIGRNLGYRSDDAVPREPARDVRCRGALFCARGHGEQNDLLGAA